MRILYVFPHPDDESFGPSRAMAAQRRQGHDVHLLTLTRGEATRVRYGLGLTLDQMGQARHRELMAVSRTLDLTGIQILNLPDGGLKELDPSTIEKPVRDEILRVEPHVVVTFPIHGISGFPDHIVTHFAVTRVYLDLHGSGLPLAAASRVLHSCLSPRRLSLARERHRTGGDRLHPPGGRCRYGTIPQRARLLRYVCGGDRPDENSSRVRSGNSFRAVSRGSEAAPGGSF